MRSASLLVLALCAIVGTRADALSLCGDGALSPGEACDDANTVTGDGCSFPSCLPEVCGDAIVNPDPPASEFCDDGGTAGGDGCDAACQLECGNGTIDPGEDCDDFGESPGCDDDCTLPECGDGNENEVSGEACDDGNTADCDGCPNDCVVVLPAQVTAPMRRCILSINQALAGVARAQSADLATCFGAVSRGNAAIAECFGTDARGKVAKAQQKATAAFLKKVCTSPSVPFLAFTSAPIVNDAAEQELLAAASAVFGDPPAIVAKASDAAGARCQAEAARQLGAVASAFLAEANRAKKTALAGGVACDVELGTQLDAAIDASEVLAKVEAKAASALARACAGAAVGDRFECGGAATSGDLTACVVTAGKRAACQALELADAIPLECPGGTP